MPSGRHPLTLLLFGLLTLASPPARSAERKPIALFDGKTLNGWTRVGGGATYRVENGEIVGEVGPGGNTFLRTDRTFANFILTLEFRLDVPGNSGIQFRSHQKPGPNGRVFGYQFEIDPSDRAWSGGIYDEARRGWLYPLTGHPEAQRALRKDGWNKVVITAEGPILRTSLNDVAVADLFDAADSEGFIALQVHAGKAGRIRWRNIELIEGSASDWKRIDTGHSLEDWHPNGGGTWTIEKEGLIHGTSSPSEKQHGHLFSPHPSVIDFALTLQFKPVKGDSGVYFHAVEKGPSRIKGYQANIDPEKDTGGLYEIDGRGWLAKPKPDDIRKWLKPGEWNDLAIIAQNTPKPVRQADGTFRSVDALRVVIQVNGHTTVDVLDEKGPLDGRIALQLHANQDVDVWFREIRLLSNLHVAF